MTGSPSPTGGAGQGGGNPHLGAALAAVAERIAPERVAEVWVFPPRAVGEKESGLAVLAVLAGEGGRDDRRALFTLRYEAEPELSPKGRPTGRMTRADVLEEQGVAPADRLDRLVEGVARRLGGVGDAPDVRPIGGDPARWADLLADLGLLDSTSGE